MAKTSKQSPEEIVADFYEKLAHPLADVVQSLRKLMLETDQEVGEQIKWNSPSFYYTGVMKPSDPKEYKRDIVVFNLHKKDHVLLVFPTGATIHNHYGLLEGTFPDSRKTATFRTLDEVQSKATDLQAVVREWLKEVDR